MERRITDVERKVSQPVAKNLKLDLMLWDLMKARLFERVAESIFDQVELERWSQESKRLEVAVSIEAEKLNLSEADLIRKKAEMDVWVSELYNTVRGELIRRNERDLRRGKISIES